MEEVRRTFIPAAGHDWESGIDGSVARWLQSRVLLLDNDESRILTLMREAGLRDVTRVIHGTMVFGLVAYSCFKSAVPPVEARHAC